MIIEKAVFIFHTFIYLYIIFKNFIIKGAFITNFDKIINYHLKELRINNNHYKVMRNAF